MIPSTDEPFERPMLGKSLAFQLEVGVAEVFHRIAVGVEDRGVEVPDRAVAGLSIRGNADVVAGNGEATTASAEDEKQPFC